MSPSEDRPTPEKNQDGHLRPASVGEVRRPRHRVCLLKGCERHFRPVHPLTRYCSAECREEARRWREWKARHRYRQSEAGKQKRQAQSRRYRMRSKRTRAAKQGPRKSREGHRKKKYLAAPAIGLAAIRNSRVSRRSPLQRFCAHSCRQALARVLQRERRWRERQQERAWRSQPTITTHTCTGRSG